MKLALYKSTKSGLPGLYNRFIRWWDRGIYSHCEIVFSDGVSASSSYMDGGVRFKTIEYNPEKWDFIELPNENEELARKWFNDHLGMKYDIIGNLRFCIGFLQSVKDTWFCSAALGASLQMDDPWRLSPNGLSAIYNSLNRNKTVLNSSTDK